MEEKVDRTLQNNKISQFILRIDFSKDSSLDFKALAEALKDDYNAFRTELHRNYNVNIDRGEIQPEDFAKFLLGKAPSPCINIDSFQGSLVIDASHYENNSVYKARLHKIIEVIKAMNADICADRIGMRYINTISCRKPAEISKILNQPFSRCVKESLTFENVSRAMVINEFNYDDFMVRVQYGVPNRFYPSVISNYDIVVDIDVYGLGRRPLDIWEEEIRKYNHKAYDIFMTFIKESFLQTLK